MNVPSAWLVLQPGLCSLSHSPWQATRPSSKEIPPPSPSEEPGFSHLPCLGEDGKPSGFSFHPKSRLASPFTTGATQKIGISSSLLSSGQHLSVLADNRTVLLSYCLTVLLSANTMQTHPFYNFAVNTEHAMKNQWTFKWINSWKEWGQTTPSPVTAINPWREPCHTYFLFDKKDLTVESYEKKGKL